MSSSWRVSAWNSISSFLVSASAVVEKGREDARPWERSCLERMAIFGTACGDEMIVDDEDRRQTRAKAPLRDRRRPATALAAADASWRWDMFRDLADY